MVKLFVKHRVGNYDTFRKVYDAFATTQHELGVKAQAICQDVADPHMITVIHDFATLDAAKALVADPRLHEAMGRAGVVGAPDIWFTTIR